MANILTGNPWVLDGTGAGTILIAHNVKIHHFELVGYTIGDTQTVQLLDSLGNPVWFATGDTTGEVVKSGNIGWIRGLQLSQISSGKVYVYFE